MPARTATTCGSTTPCSAASATTPTVRTTSSNRTTRPGQSLLLTPTATSAGHAFCSTNDQDWFRFSGVASNQHRIETLNLGGGNDTVVTLYNSSPHTTRNRRRRRGRVPRLEDHLRRRQIAAPITSKPPVSAGSRSFGYTYDLRITRDTPPTITAPATAVRNGTTLANPSPGVYRASLRDTWTRSDPDGIASQDLEKCRKPGCSFTDVSPQPAPAATTYDYVPPIGTRLQRRIRASSTRSELSAPTQPDRQFTVQWRAGKLTQLHLQRDVAHIVRSSALRRNVEANRRGRRHQGDASFRRP